jgi:hypothetical protein
MEWDMTEGGHQYLNGKFADESLLQKKIETASRASLTRGVLGQLFLV